MTFDLTSIVSELAHRRVAWVDGQLANLNPGETLCVHEDHGDCDPHSDRITVREYAHVLEPAESCDMDGRRRQYGPVPADWPEVVERMRS